MDYTKTLLGSKVLLACMLATQLGGVNQASAATGIKAMKTDSPIVQQNQITVTGVVKDANGEPITGAAVVVKGTTNGTITDIDGKYSISVPEGSMLSFSFVGFKTHEVRANKTTLNVVMQEEAIGLDEVVAIGYGYVKKRDLTGAVSSVSADDMVMGGTVSNAAQALQGKTAGVQVQQTSKAPGGSISVRVRGSNSISSTNEPLYVVDGFPSTEGLNINPNDIESMQILKDASATAIYGARGANGVVLITTKRGKAGENKISYNGYVGVQQVQNPFDFISAKDYMNLQNALYQEIEGQEGNPYGVYTPSQLESTVDTDWLDVCTQLGVVHDHTISFQGGTEKTKVMTSLGFYNQEGVLKNTDFNRISGRVNVDQTITDWIKAGASLYAHREQSNYQAYSGNIVSSNVLNGILTYDPTVKPYNDDGSYGTVPGGRGDNPLANLLERQNDETNDKFNGTAFVEINPLEGLTAKASVGVEILHQFRGTYLPKSTYEGGIDGGIASTYDLSNTRQVFEGTINYMKTFNDVHDFGAMVGYTYEKFSEEYRSQQAKGFSTDQFTYNNMGAASQVTDWGSNKTENILISFFGRVNYTYNNKYLATVTVRRDGSSRFGANEHWGTFPSGSLAWRASEEDFIKNWGVFSNLKVRAGFGVTGNERIGDYASYALMANTRYTFDGSTNSAGIHMNQSSAANPNLKWEINRTANVAMEFGLFNRRVYGSLEWYYKKGIDLLGNRQVSLVSGFSTIQVNWASMKNTGWEFAINTINIDTDAFRWTSNLNFGYNYNEVLDVYANPNWSGLTDPQRSNYAASAVVGKPINGLWSFQYAGLNEEGRAQFLDAEGNKVLTGMSDIDGLVYSGTTQPLLQGGFTNTFYYKKFTLSALFIGSFGNVIRLRKLSDNYAFGFPTPDQNMSKDFAYRWRQPGDEAHTDVPRLEIDEWDMDLTYPYPANVQMYNNSDLRTVKGNFLRLSNLSLSYDLYNDNMRAKGIQNSIVWYWYN